MNNIPEKLRDRCNNTKIVFVTGHYGSGKTEMAINLALEEVEEQKNMGRSLALVDIDIVNPYFRSRDKKKFMEDKGIRVISTSKMATDADVPALPADIYSAFDSPDQFTIFDVGGDPVGARVLGRYNKEIKATPYEFFIVVNKNRPLTATPEAAKAYIELIEATARLKATGIVGNSHLCGMTTLDEVKEGIEYAEEVSKMTGLDVICHTVERSFAEQLDRDDILPIDIFMKKPWEL